jgi:hypothetical protein
MQKEAGQALAKALKFPMSKTRLYIECPNCHTQYLMKKGELTYSSGAYIENVAGVLDAQRLLCPCRPHTPYRFKMSERQRLHVFSSDENERTHFTIKQSAPKSDK